MKTQFLTKLLAYAYRNYGVLGFEDLYGGLGASGTDPLTGKRNEYSDRDFNDVVMAVDIGAANIKDLY